MITPEQRLRRRQARLERASAHIGKLRLERDAAIRAYIAAGHSHADAYRVLDGALTRARIGQIALGVRSASPPPAA